MGRRGVLVVTVLVTLIASLAVAPAAPAASVIFISEGDLFAASADGVTVRRLADASPQAPFAAPSVAPDGTIWAIFGGRLVHLSATGATLGAIQPVSPTAPVDAVVSPDGTKLAYVANDAAGVRSTWYTRTDGTGGEVEFGVQTGLGGPSWLDATRVILDRGVDATADNVVVDTVDAGATPPASWFTDAVQRPFDGAVNPALTFGAWITEAGTSIDLYSLTGPPPAVPTNQCAFRGTGVQDPAWSPDSGSVAWGDADGVWISPIPSLSACTSLTARRVGPAQAAAPHWSPLDLAPGLPSLAADGKPRVLGLALVPNAFAAATGSTLQFTLTGTGTASVAVVRLTEGVRKGRSCVAGRAKKKLQRCTRRAAVGTATQSAVIAGAVSLPFARADLAPGRYELWVVVTDLVNRTSAPRRVRFTVQ